MGAAAAMTPPRSQGTHDPTHLAPHTPPRGALGTYAEDLDGLPNIFITPTKGKQPAGANPRQAGSAGTNSHSSKSPTGIEDDPLIANILYLQQQQREFGENNPLRNIDKAKPGTIARRTRSQVPLVDADWNDLDLLGFDASGNATAASPTSENEDAPEYWQFLHGLHNGGPDFDLDDSDANDAEYDFLKDEAMAKADEPSDEFRTDKAVRITKEELKFIQETAKDLERADNPGMDTYASLLSTTQPSRGANLHLAKQQVPEPASKKAPSKKKDKAERNAKKRKMQKFLDLADRFKPAPSLSPFKAPAVRAKLQQQLCQHLQLLVQQLVLIRSKRSDKDQPGDDKDSSLLESKVEAMIKEVEGKLLGATARGGGSIFYVDAMADLLLQLDARAARGAPKEASASLTLLSKADLKALVHGANRHPFFRSELVPACLIKTKHTKHRRLKWHIAEDRLLALGVIVMRGNFEEIKRHYFGENKTVKQMLNRFQNAALGDRVKAKDKATQPLIAVRDKELTLRQFYNQYLAVTKCEPTRSGHARSMQPPAAPGGRRGGRVKTKSDSERAADANAVQPLAENGLNKPCNMPSHHSVARLPHRDAAARAKPPPATRVKEFHEGCVLSMDGESSTEGRPQRTNEFKEEDMDAEADNPRPQRSEYFVEHSMDDELKRPKRTEHYATFDLDDASSSSTSLQAVLVHALKKPFDSLAVVASSRRQTELVNDQRRRNTPGESKKAPDKPQAGPTLNKSGWTRDQDKQILLQWKKTKGNWSAAVSQKLAKTGIFPRKTHAHITSRYKELMAKLQKAKRKKSKLK